MYLFRVFSFIEKSMQVCDSLQLLHNAYGGTCPAGVKPFSMKPHHCLGLRFRVPIGVKLGLYFGVILA